jgi:hypothetical protein
LTRWLLFRRRLRVDSVTTESAWHRGALVPLESHTVGRRSALAMVQGTDWSWTRPPASELQWPSVPCTLSYLPKRDTDSSSSWVFTSGDRGIACGGGRTSQARSSVVLRSRENAVA